MTQLILNLLVFGFSGYIVSEIIRNEELGIRDTKSFLLAVFFIFLILASMSEIVNFFMK